jgi:hypothetical protein
LLLPVPAPALQWDEQGSQSLAADLVVQVSRTLPPATAVGLIINKESDNNYYVIFPHFKVDDARRVFREESSVRTPFALTPGAKLNFWALAVDDKLKLGSVYASLDQIKSSSSDVALSEKVVINVQ